MISIKSTLTRAFLLLGLMCSLLQSCLAFQPARQLLGVNKHMLSGKYMAKAGMEPTREDMKSKNDLKKAAGALGVLGLIFGKINSDGPVYGGEIGQNMLGKTVVITGGNTGLGLETAVRLAALGAEVMPS